KRTLYSFPTRRSSDLDLPRPVHLRGPRPDAGLVLHAARAGDGALRPPRFPELRGVRPDPGRGRPEDVEEPAQLPRPRAGLRRVRSEEHTSELQSRENL